MPESAQGVTPGQFGPVMRGGRSRRKGWRRVAFVTLSVLAIASLTATAVAGVLVWRGYSGIAREDIAGLGDQPTPVAAERPQIEEIDRVLNVLIVGSDSREGLTKEELQQLGTERTDTQLTDTIIVLQLDPRRDRAALLSIPRDLYVRRCDGSKGRINAAYVVGENARDDEGPECLVETVEDVTGIPLDHYVEVDLAGFIKVVEALGGVSLYLEEPLRDRAAGLDLPAGCVELDGKEALAFARARQLDNDFGRMARQQRLAREVVSEMTSAGTLANLPKLFRLVNAVSRAVKVDEDLSLTEMRRIAFSMREFSSDGLETRTVPGDIRTIGGASYVVPDEEEAEVLFRAFRTGAVFPERIGTQPAEVVGVDDVPAVTVLNGSGQAGVARSAADVLTERGFEVEETGNAQRFDFRRTQVIYPPHLAEEAQVLASVFPGVAVVPGEADEPLRVVVGRDFDPDEAESPTPAPSTDRAPARSAEDADESDTPGAQYKGAQPSNVEC